jgi:hypothetical protein
MNCCDKHKWKWQIQNDDKRGYIWWIWCAKQRHGKVAPLHATKAYAEVHVQLHSFLTLGWDRGEWCSRQSVCKGGQLTTWKRWIQSVRNDVWKWFRERERKTWKHPCHPPTMTMIDVLQWYKHNSKLSLFEPTCLVDTQYNWSRKYAVDTHVSNYMYVYVLNVCAVYGKSSSFRCWHRKGNTNDDLKYALLPQLLPPVNRTYAPGSHPDCGKGINRLACAGPLYVQENLDTSCLQVQGFEPESLQPDTSVQTEADPHLAEK